MAETFSDAERDTVHRLIRTRRDIRHFSAMPVPTDILIRMLEAAHQAPSVGFMQPWNFILVSSLEIRRQIKASFESTNAVELNKLNDMDRQNLYRQLKLEGILESPLNIAVTCDRRRDAPFVLGRAPMPDTDVYSTCLAIQNMWLAGRVEGIGLGWISLIDHAATGKILHLPEGVKLVAYLCVGYPVEFRAKPLLEEVGWKSRLSLNALVYQDTWGTPAQVLIP
ncbi:MAG: 5,6-dimethylbenzimidazole synthase [Chloroflexi bacterium]|nr:5,6-dimethylbenzimidazole synthase [Chloroflexota bacterium]